jgi:pyruvate ferredoxin oxidoreductase alpha subunit
LAHKKQIDALGVIQCVGDSFKQKFGRDSGGLLHEYNIENAETVVVALGSVAGTIKDATDELNAAGERFGVLSIASYRPFPAEAIRNSLKNAKRAIVVEKAFAVGIGGILSQEIELALKGLDVEVVSIIAGLGGRNITKSALKDCFLKKDHEKTTFLGLKEEIIAKEYQPLKGCGCKGGGQ